jgi:superoxide dismutase, Cu-Zn family
VNSIANTNTRQLYNGGIVKKRLVMKAILTTLKTVVIALVLGVLMLVYGCEQDTTQGGNQPQTAQAIIKSTSDPSKTLGDASFSLTEKGMAIEAQVNNAPPGQHAFHIHEVGSCEDQGNAAKGHFNPDQVKHGLLSKDGFQNAHAGDLGNMTISPQGEGTLSQTISGLTFSGGKYAIEGLSVILHEKVDDFGQPTGNAGGRIGCGIISKTGA